MPSVPLPPPLSRRRIVGLSLAAAGVGLADVRRSAAGPAGALSPTDATVKVEDSQIGVIGPEFGGLSYEKAVMTQRLFTASNANLIGLFHRLGPSLLRLGGNTVEQQVWTAGGTGGVRGQIAPADVDALAGFLKATGWKCLYGVNLAGVATNATSPVLAAEEVRYVSRALGASLAGIEIGNEPDLYGHGGSFPIGTWTVSVYEALWRRFRDAIVAAAPGVVLTGPATAGSVDTWTRPFAVAERGRIQLLTHHYYRANGQDPASTAAKLITTDWRLHTELDALKHAGWAAGAPVRLAECNSYYNGGAPGVSNGYASALWVIDFLFTCAIWEVSGVNLHGGGRGAYTTIADQNGAVVEVRPQFYGLTLFQLAGQGRILRTTIDAQGRTVTAYAVASSTGALRLVLVNKDFRDDLDIAVSLPRAASRATALTLGQRSPDASGPSLTAASGVTLQGAAVGLDGGWNPAPPDVVPVKGGVLTVRAPRLSAVLVTVT